MMSENFKILVDKLKEKTTRNEAIWSKTSRDNEFKLDLDKGAITIDMWYNQDIEEKTVDITVINDRGDIIDNIYFNSSDEEGYKYLLELHTLVRQAYYKVDETFKSIFKELDSDKIIGTEEKDDELPF